MFLILYLKIILNTQMSLSTDYLKEKIVDTKLLIEEIVFTIAGEGQDL